LSLAPALVLFAGCPDPTQPQPLTELKPVSGPPPRPAPPPSPPAPEPAPEADKPLYSADAAPLRFTLTRHHRASLSQLEMLPEYGSTFALTTLPVVNYSSAEDLELGRPPSQIDLPMLLVTKKDGRLAIRFAEKKEQFPGGEGWLILVTDAARTGAFKRLPLAFPRGENKRARGRSSIEVGMLKVDSLGSFRVRSLAAAKAWKVTVTARPAAGEAVPPIVALVPDLLPGAKAVQLDGKPVNRHTVILNPGSYRLSGAAGLWMTVPSVDGMALADLEVELAAIP
jgi:hypothetical protein